MTTEPGTQAAAPEAAGATPARKASSLRWLAWGTGAAIEIRATELLVAAVRVRPSGAALLGAARIPDYRTRPAVEWGAEVTSFLRKLGAGHVAVTALLPRSEVIVRVISLPGVAASDTEAAIRLQLDSLHPFSDEDAVFSFARLGKTGDVLVGIARRETVDAWSTLFAEAGIKTAAFTFSAAAVYSAARLLNTPASIFVTACRAEDDIEIYGESEARPLYTATLPVAPE
ncbi:MAG TPA: pilus assembly protein PilM, partial [Bryobacteraceae bacterium]|nr:pilus assembly protein PilM [Bryobacteraceae bacterium]